MCSYRRPNGHQSDFLAGANGQLRFSITACRIEVRAVGKTDGLEADFAAVTRSAPTSERSEPWASAPGW